MDFDKARRFCAALPATTQDIKWGADLCFCVGSRMYAVTWLDARGKASGFSFKVDDHRFLELTERPGIVPAPYLARARWVQVKDAAALTDAEARDLLARSHALVAARLTRALQRELGLAALLAPILKAPPPAPLTRLHATAKKTLRPARPRTSPT